MPHEPPRHATEPPALTRAEGERPDLRAVLLGISAWAGGLAAFGLPGWTCVVLLALALLGVVARRRRGGPIVTLTACLLAAVAVAGAATVRVHLNRTGVVASLAQQRSLVTASGPVVSDPVLRRGRFGSYSLTKVLVDTVSARDLVHHTRSTVLVVGDRTWARARLGARVQVTGRLDRSSGPDLAGVLVTRSPPTTRSPPPKVFEAAAGLRTAIRRAVTGVPADARALVPALVVGDDQQMSDQVVEDFRTCGLTHLAAVSGTNLTLVVGFLLLVARWVGVRARGLTVVGVLGVAGFVLLARPEPSVLRAAAMGSVALLGMGARGRDQGVRALGVAVFALLLVDPWLVRSLGFVLSSLATAGILFLAPPMRDALLAWLPRWAAEAVAVPLAAQIACTPVVAAVADQVSLVAVPANLLAAAAVGPATVLGLVGGLALVVVPPLGHLCGWLAGMCAWWIIALATTLSRLPTAAMPWSPGPVSLAVLGVLCLVMGLGARPVLRRPRWAVPLCVVLVVVMLRPLPTPGWPPQGWVMVACDVGQGDGLVLNAGGGRAVVVDAGPDPRAMARCLDRLHVHGLPVVVLTHFHADHVGGLPGVLDGHRVGEVDVTATDVPRYGAVEVRRWTAAAHVSERVPRYGEVRAVGPLTWQVIGPTHAAAAGDAEGTVANDASLVLLVRTRGIRLLLSGDMEPDAQQWFARSLPRLRVDVLKVPHHGSRYQDPQLLGSLGARLAVVSVGKHNDYGHPALATLQLLRRAGMRVERTGLRGDIAVTVRHGHVGVRTRADR